MILKTKVIITIAMLLMTAVHVYGQETRTVSYISRYWNEDTKQVESETRDIEAEVINSVRYDTGQLGYDGTEKWYIVDNKRNAQKKLSFEGLYLRGIVHIIVLDGCELRVLAGIHLPGDSKLYIYSQSDGENQGKVTIKGKDGRAGIGNSYWGKTGDLYIHGCDIDVTGGPDGGAAIGTSQCYTNGALDGKRSYTLGNVYVYGGKVRAQGGEGGGAGIGGGLCRLGQAVGGVYYQYGGEVTAWGGDLAAGIGGGGSWYPIPLLPNTMGVGGSGITVKVYGGSLTAYGGRRAAGIGSGNGNRAGGLGGGYFYMYGGSVYAKGGNYGAGIGGGCNVFGGTEYLYGGTLTAIGGKNAAGIGGGEDGRGGTTIVDGATVRAVGNGPAAGIGGGEGQYVFSFEYKSGTVVAIAGGDCKARESKGGSAIGSGKKEKEKKKMWNVNGIKLSDNCKVTAGDNEDNIERTFTNGEREPACRWRNYVKIEACEHENAIFTYLNETRHYRECKNCNYRHEEIHSVEIGKDCPCGKKYNADTDTWVVTVVESADGKTYAAGKEQRIVKGRDYVLPQATSIEGMIFMGYIEATTAPASLEMQDSEFTSLLTEGTTVTPNGNRTYYARYRYYYDEEWTWNDDLSAATVKISNSLLNDSRTLNATVTEITEERVEPTENEMGIMSLQASASIERSSGVRYEFNDYTKTEFFNIAQVELDAEASNNEEMLEPYEDHIGYVSIYNLTFRKDGKLHPLCLPVSLTKKEIEAGPLADATFYRLDETTLEGKQLQISFKKITEDYIVAGEPYYVKWASGSNVENPEFSYAYIHNATPSSVSDGYFTHIGTYDKAAIDEEALQSGHFLTLNDDEKLVDVPDGMIDAFSSFLYIPRRLADDGTATINCVRLSFEDGITIENALSYGFDGEGTEKSPYIIGTASQLISMAAYFNSGDNDIKGKYFKQGANITFDKTVANNFTPVKTFTGYYDGDGYTISGLNICPDDPDDASLFGNVKENSLIKNVIIRNSTFNGRNAAAVACSVYDNAGVDNCHVLKDVTISSGYSAGGVVGFVNGSSSARVTGCTSQATVNGYSGVGAILGVLTMGYVGSNISLSSNINGTAQASAVVGYRNSGMIEHCYFTAPTLSEPRAKLMPQIAEDNTEFLTLLNTRDQFLLEDNSELKESDICYDITLTERTLYKDGDWNTLCLPFALSAEQIAASPLAGCTLKELDTEGTYDTDNKTGYAPATGTLSLYFKDATTIAAGKPYLVKWESGADIVNPVFTGVTISNVNTPVTSSDKNVTFIGNYSPVHLTGGDASNLYLGAANKLYWPTANRTINAFCGYFHVNLDGELLVREIRLNLDSTTGVEEVQGDNVQCSNWYDLQGRKLSGKPTQKGVYIHNGKKVVIDF